jgi:methyltransferase (TIGR00027 family)
MTTRAASSTAVLVCQGRAVADGRIAVGTFADPVARELLDAGERAVVDAVREGRVPSTGAGRMSWEMVRQTAFGMVPRTIAIDRAVRDASPRQVVLLGAGLDARAWRMPELATATVWEVDHPASQEDMRRRVGDRRPAAAHLEWVPVDLASQPLAAPLVGAGFDRHGPS